MEIAKRWFELFIAENRNEPNLPKICFAVVSDFSSKFRDVDNFDIKNASKLLERKFEKDRDLWLARVTTGDGQYAPERRDDIRRVIFALKALRESGIPVDLEKVVVTAPLSPS